MFFQRCIFRIRRLECAQRYREGLLVCCPLGSQGPTPGSQGAWALLSSLRAAEVIREFTPAAPPFWVVLGYLSATHVPETLIVWSLPQLNKENVWLTLFLRMSVFLSPSVLKSDLCSVHAVSSITQCLKQSITIFKILSFQINFLWAEMFTNPICTVRLIHKVNTLA